MVAIVTADGVRAKTGNPLGIVDQGWIDGPDGLPVDAITVLCSDCKVISTWHKQTGELLR